MFVIKFGLDRFKGPTESPKDRRLSHLALRRVLDCLTGIDADYLRAYPETPLLYQSGIRYAVEPSGQELFYDVPTILKERWPIDCLPLSTLVLRDDYTFAPIGSLAAGDRIMGDGAWTTVLDGCATGVKPILRFVLDNGCVLQASPEHRLLLQDGTEKRAGQVCVGDRLLSPRSLPCGEREIEYPGISSEDLAWLVGTYVADGWVQHNGFFISGDDDNPKRGKREQKDRAKAILETAGIKTWWGKKSMGAHERDLTAIMKRAGGVAPEKRVPDIAVTERQVRALLAGLQTDCSLANSGTLTHGTVSPTLALQLRVLYRMIGKSVHIRRWDEHGGLGENPIYRVTVRDHHEPKNALWETRYENLATSARVRSISESEPEMCCDITTDSGRFYLPETDLVVHNCEDLACWRAAELQVRHNVPAIATFSWHCPPDRCLYHVKTLDLRTGQEEDSSRILGMR